MLDDVMRSCSRSPESSILFCDEMSSVVQKGTLDTAVLRHLGDEITTKFQARSNFFWLLHTISQPSLSLSTGHVPRGEWRPPPLRPRPPDAAGLQSG